VIVTTDPQLERLRYERVGVELRSNELAEQVRNSSRAIREVLERERINHEQVDRLLFLNVDRLLFLNEAISKEWGASVRRWLGLNAAIDRRLDALRAAVDPPAPTPPAAEVQP